MPGNEDYLDGLLDSITKAKSDVRRSERRERIGREERVARRNRVAPEDDFMEANGLHGRSSRRGDRRSRRSRGRSFLDDLFDDFDEDESYGEDDDDDFIRAFERELEENGDDVDPFNLTDEGTLRHGTDSKESEKADSPASGSAKDAILGDIASIVSEAKAKIEEGSEDDLLQTINEQMGEPAPESFTAGLSGDESSAARQAEGGMPAAPPEKNVLPPEYDVDDLDLTDEPDLAIPESTEAKEVSLMDESGDGLDLIDMISADGEDDELVDIGELLSSDEAGEELPEALETYEAGAESAASGGGGTESAEAAAAEGEPAEKKPGLLAKILSIFKKKEQDGDSAVGVVDPTPEQLAAESEEILEDEEDDEDDEETPEEKKARKKKEKEEAQAKKKAEKEAAKKAKEAAKKEADAKKQAAKAAKAAAKAAKPKKKKKKKEPEPKIPILAIIPFIILSVSLVAGVNIIMKVLSYQPVIDAAQESYDKQDYMEAYEGLAGLTLSDEDRLLRDQAKTMAFLETKYREYQVCMDIGKYQMALDSLIDAMNYYKENEKTAKSLNIVDIYSSYGNDIERALSDDFNLTPDEAVDIWKSLTRKEYTAKIQRAIRAAGLEDEY